MSNAYKRPIPSVGVYGTSAHYGGAHLRSRRQASAAWLWGCGFLSSLACVGGCLLGVVIGMIGFRALPDDLQAAAARRAPILAVLMAPTATPDPRLEVVPTIDPTRAAEAARAFGVELIDASPTPPFQPRSGDFPTLTPTPVHQQSCPPHCDQHAAPDRHRRAVARPLLLAQSHPARGAGLE